ncbi:MAG: hypothetical protein FWF69_01770 [Firmicutes bacterium]|nr:hypothetical protein [Bacillota bacterium]
MPPIPAAKDRLAQSVFGASGQAQSSDLARVHSNPFIVSPLWRYARAFSVGTGVSLPLYTGTAARVVVCVLGKAAGYFELIFHDE